MHKQRLRLYGYHLCRPVEKYLQLMLKVISLDKTSNLLHNAMLHMPLYSWWRRRQMEASFALLALCAENPPVTGKFPSQRPVTQGFDFYSYSASEPTVQHTMETAGDFETPSHSLLCHCNVYIWLPVAWGNASIALGSGNQWVSY